MADELNGQGLHIQNIIIEISKIMRLCNTLVSNSQKMCLNSHKFWVALLFFMFV